MARSTAKSGRRRRGPDITGRLLGWLATHGEVAGESLQRLLGKPVATLMTAATVAIALALPAALHLAVANLERLGGQWQHGTALSLFLRAEVGEAHAAELAADLARRPAVAAAAVIPPAQGLEELRAYGGLDSALDALDDNPLPVVIELELTPAGLQRGPLERLVETLAALPEGDFVRQDAEWIQRFEAILRLLRQTNLALAILLGLGVLLVVGNTVRLEIENRRREIQVMALVGATPAFARRPFLYSGAGYGLLGGLIAWLLVLGLGLLLTTPVQQLAALYHTEFRLRGLDAPISAVLLLGSPLLATLGSWIAVERHLRLTDPS